MSAYVYALVNQKGGIGKTTAAIHLGTGLQLRGFKTLIIDMDAQCNLTLSLKGDYQHKPTIMDAILGKVDIFDTIQHLDEVDVIPGSNNLSTLESRIDSRGKEFFLADAIEPLIPEYDFIVLDSPPALSLITVGIMCAADSIIIPVGMDMYSFQGTGQLYRTYNAVKQFCNPDLTIEGILITQSAVSLKKTLAEIAYKMNTQIFDSAILPNVIVKHAVIHQQSLYKYAPKSKPASEFSAFVDELLEKSKDRWMEVVNDSYTAEIDLKEFEELYGTLEDELKEIGVDLKESQSEYIIDETNLRKEQNND